MRTTSRISTLSYSKWSCFSEPTRVELGISTPPLVASSSPDIARRSVDLPDPFAPTMP